MQNNSSFFSTVSPVALHYVGFCAYLTLGNIIKTMCCCYNKSEKWMAENQIIKHSSNTSLCDYKCQNDSVNLGSNYTEMNMCTLNQSLSLEMLENNSNSKNSHIFTGHTLADPKYFHELLHELNTYRGHFLRGMES